MVQIQSAVRRHVPQLLLIALLGAATGDAGPNSVKFYPDDPIEKIPPPVNVGKLPEFDVGALYDFFVESFSSRNPPATPSRGFNTLGEVPDSAWFTNRHGRKRMSAAELQCGPCGPTGPVAPFTVVGAKLGGVTPGFRMTDANGVLFFVKPDPPDHPELSTGADVIGSRFFYAIGYNTPENYIVQIDLRELKISPKATTRGAGGRRRQITTRDLRGYLYNSPRQKDGKYRMIASRVVPGESIGPFRYLGTRSDDPNDLIPHEQRRDLRGLQVFCAWLNHTDAKAENSLDAVVEQGGHRFVRHYLIDFGSAFGSDGDMPKNARFGNAYVVPETRAALFDMGTFGADVKPWESANYGHYKSVGRFQAKVFDQGTWVSNYPNPAFIRRQPDDEYWAAKIVMSFSREDIRTIVQTGQYSDPGAVDYLVEVLAERREKIGRACFSRVLPLDNFEVVDDTLRFDDLAVKYGLAGAVHYKVSWFRFNNQTQQSDAIPGAVASFRLPAEVSSAPDKTYFSAVVTGPLEDKKTVTVYLNRRGGQWKLVGIDRRW
jgi:hypothetical protein